MRHCPLFLPPLSNSHLPCRVSLRFFSYSCLCGHFDAGGLQGRHALVLCQIFAMFCRQFNIQGCPGFVGYLSNCHRNDEFVKEQLEKIEHISSHNLPHRVAFSMLAHDLNCEFFIYFMSCFKAVM